VTGVEVTAGDRAALANTTVRFEVVPAGSRETVASQDVMLSPAGPLGQFVRATLNLAGASPGEYVARASIVAAGTSLGVVDAPFQLAK
jgi:hypothetical protein